MKKKLSHIWLYYKWYIIVAAVLAVIAADHLWQVGSRKEPDYYAAVVTGGYVSETARDALAQELERLWPDRDGDGSTRVTINFYQYDAQTAESMNPASFMASAVQLAADFRLEISDCFVTDCPELLLDNNALRSYGAPEENGIKGITELEGFAVLGYGETLQDLH